MTYIDFINNILTTRGRFSCDENSYHERHHIKPKCLGGINDKDNLIDLYAQEHFIAHKLLAQENPDNPSLVSAYAIMAFTKNPAQKERYELTPDEYAEARRIFSESRKKLYSNPENHPCYGTHISEERKQLISRINKGNKYCVGRKYSPETLKKMSISHKKENLSEETRKRMSEAQKKRNLNGGNNPRAKKVIRLSDGKIYDCAKEAAIDNNINYSTFKGWLHRKTQGFLYYEDYQS